MRLSDMSSAEQGASTWTWDHRVRIASPAHQCDLVSHIVAVEHVTRTFKAERRHFLTAYGDAMQWSSTIDGTVIG